MHTSGRDRTKRDRLSVLSGKSYFAADVPEVVLKSLFRKYDTDDSKSLGKREMLKLLKEDLGFEDDRAQACILMVDKDGCGEISFDEFILWIRTEKGFGNIDNNSRFYIIQKAIELFKKYDKDGNDTTDREEFKKLMMSLDVSDDEKVDNALLALDKGGDGKISFTEFLAWLNGPFPSSPQPPFQSEAKCESVFIHIEIGTDYHNKNFALRFALKERLRETRKWSIGFLLINFVLKDCSLSC